MRMLACLTWSLLLVGPALARPRSPAPAAPVAKPVPAPKQDGAVRGRVATPWGWGIRQRIVRIGEKRTFTDGEGRFTIEDVPRSYDIEILERDGLHATAYYGLTSRAPILVHKPWPALNDGYLEKRDVPPSAGTGRIAGKVELLRPKAPSFDDQSERLSFIYVFHDGGSAINLGGCSPHSPPRGDLEGCSADGAYDCELPDFSALRGTYCILIGIHPATQTRAMRCGGKLGMKDFSIPPQPQAPKITVGDKEDTDRILSWTGEGQVFELNLGKDYMGTFVRVYTSQRSFTWSELAALGVNFAWNRAVTIEGVKVTALLPYTSMDDLVSGRGPMAMGTSWRIAESSTVDIRLPDGFKAAALTARPTIFRPENPRSVPTCASSDDSAIGVDDLRSNMANTRVTVRGHLVCGGSRCVERGCIADWVMVEAGKPRDGLRLQRAEDIAPLEDHAGLCDPPNHPDIEVRATGLLLSRNPKSWTKKGPEGPEYLLDQASFCAIGPAPEP